MNCYGALVNVSKFVWLIITAALLTATGISQQDAGNMNWQRYSPERSSFSIRVPGDPLPAQGHIFDPSDNVKAHRLIKNGMRAKTYNFEFKKGDKRSFLVSILEVQTTNLQHQKFISDQEAQAITTVIGDDIQRSRISRQSLRTGKVSKWTYKRKSDSGNSDEPDGMVQVISRGQWVVIVVVDFDHAMATDPEIKGLLTSVRIR